MQLRGKRTDVYQELSTTEGQISVSGSTSAGQTSVSAH